LRQPLCGILAALLLMCGALSPASAARPAGESSAKIAADAPAANPGKLSIDLRPLLTSPESLPAEVTWAKSVNGQVLVKVLIVAASTDAELVSLRADVIARGGSVFYNYLSVRAVAAMDGGSEYVEIVRAVLTLGQALGKNVVAEGIETAAQLATLRRLGVPAGQGYLLSRPLRPEQVPALLHAPAAMPA
jgi:EAL domain